MMSKEEAVLSPAMTTALSTGFMDLRKDIAELKKKNGSFHFDISTKKGEAGARSYINDLRKIKPMIAETHKVIKHDALVFGKAADKEKRFLTGELDDMIEFHYADIRKIDDAKKAAAALEIEISIAWDDARFEEAGRRERAVKEGEAKLAAEAETQRREKIAKEEAEKFAAAEVILAEGRANRATREAAEKAEREKLVAVKAVEERQRKAAEASTAFDTKMAAIEKKRVEDEDHRKKIHDEISEYIREHLQYKGDITQNDLMNALVRNEIPHVTITY